MALKIEECNDSDMDRAFEIISSAFGHEHPFMESVFPLHATPQGRRLGGQRMLASKKADPNSTFLKVVDTSTGEVVAQAKWNIYNGSIPDEFELDGDFWESENEKEYAQHMFREYLVLRRKAIRDLGGRLVVLDILTVDPNHQRRGAGRMLVRWGTAIADQMGVETVVESTKYGLGLYLSEGFEFKSHWEIPLPEKWADRKHQEFDWLVRPAKQAR